MKQALPVLVCFALSVSPGDQARLLLKTVGQKLLGAAPHASLEHGRLEIATFKTHDRERYRVPFSPDGRELLPQLSVALAEPALVGQANADLVPKPRKPVVTVESFWSLQFTLADGTRIHAQKEFLPLTAIRYSADFKHWAIGLIDVIKGRRNVGATIIHDGKEIKRIEQPLAGKGDKSLLSNILRVDDGVLLYDEYTWECDMDRNTRQTPIPDMALSPDGLRLAYVVDTGKGRGGVYLVLDAQEGPRFDSIPEGSLEFSPDSRHFAYFADYNRADNTATLVYDGREVPVRGMGGSWLIRGNPLRFRLSPDGTYVIIPVGHTSGFGDYKTRYRILDMKQAQGSAWNEEFVDIVFSRDGSKHLIVEETATKQQRVQGFPIHEYLKVENLSLSDDGTQSAWAASFRGKWVAVVNGQHRTPYLEIRYLTLSPDGKHVAYAAKNAQKKWVFVVDETEWGPYERIEEPRKDDHPLYYPGDSVFFSPDSQHTAVTVRQDTLASLVVDGTVIASFKKMGTPVFSHEGRRTAVWASDGDKEFIVLDGKPLPGFEEVDKWRISFSPDGKHIAYMAKTGKRWCLVVDGTPSSSAFDEIVTAHADKRSFVFPSPDSLYYVGLRDKMLYLVDEKIEMGVPGEQSIDPGSLRP